MWDNRCVQHSAVPGFR
ncbi:MAG: hypothetical protein OXH68_20890 [Gammaproteobacteria bacterium]|nr:hypothetical protein [Gammaproteobacteria bacterium]